jgi:prevent-host-death family protein
VAAGEFKAKCLSILDDVNETGEPVIVTKRGKPVARVTAYEQAAHRNDPDSIFGFMRGMAIIVDGADLVTSDFDEKEWLKSWDRVERENPLGRKERP